MEITWLGNSTFLLKTNLSKKILIDPFNILKTYPNKISADILTYSKNINSNFQNENYNKTKILSCGDNFNTSSLKINSYKTFSDSINGMKRGENFIYTFEIEGLKLCHLGYLGEMPNIEILKNISSFDFLFVPIGGNICLNGSEAFNLVSILKPKYIIPMCYRCSNSDFFFNDPLEFLSKYKNIFRLNSNTLLTNNIPNSSGILLFDK